MDPSFKKRIDRAWENSKDWITEFDGSPTLTLLLDIPAGSLLPAFRSLAQETENLRITAIPADNPDSSQFIPLESIPDYLARLQEGEIVELSANYGVRFEAFDLDIHMVIYAMEAQKVALELLWWSDQVFSEETDNYAQFAALLGYFTHLQGLFSSQNLFISPESGIGPGQELESWLEV